MYFAIWALIVGALLITMGLSGTSLRRLPVSTAMLYLAAGFGLGPAGLALMAPDPLTCSGILERAAEVAVLISLFAVGLKLGLPLSDKGWRLPVRLAIVSMTITVVLIAVLGMVGLGLSLGAAVPLGAILAPTDPVLASDADRRGRDRSGVGAMLSYTYLHAGAVWFVLLLFLVLRPVSVWLGLLGAPVSRDQRIMISWFGIRGIGSIYYLMYATFSHWGGAGVTASTRRAAPLAPSNAVAMTGASRRRA